MTSLRMLDKTTPPTDMAMSAAIGHPALAQAWSELRRFLLETYTLAPAPQFGGPRYGWSLAHRAGSRPLCELYPEHGSFTALVVLGKAELEQAMARQQSFGDTVRRALLETPRLHDGCWLYIRVADPQTAAQDAQDIAQLILLKKKPPRRAQTAGPL